MLCRAQGQDKVKTAALKATTAQFHSHQHSFNLKSAHVVGVLGCTKKFYASEQVPFGSEMQNDSHTVVERFCEEMMTFRVILTFIVDYENEPT